MARVSAMVYNALFRRTSTFAATIMFGAFFFERAFDMGAEYIFETINRGVEMNLNWKAHIEVVATKLRLAMFTQKLWKHIKDKYES